MAESQESPEQGTAQDAGTVAEVGQPTGTDATAGSDQVTSVPSESQPDAELDEIRRTVSAGGEKAVGMFEHQQRVASKHATELSKYKPLAELVDRLGAENVKTHLLQYDFLMSNPEAKAAVLDYYQTQQWKSSAAPDDHEGNGFGDEDDPMVQRLAALEQQVGLQNVKTANQDMKSHMRSFFDKPIAENVKVTMGEVLTPEEKSQIMGGLEAQIRGLSANEQGQQTLRNMNAEMVERMMRLQLSTETLAQIGERIHLKKIEQKRAAATGAAPTGATTGDEDRAYSGTLAEQVTEFCREEGIDPYNLSK